jgi:hypothetical protein
MLAPARGPAYWRFGWVRSSRPATNEQTWSAADSPRAEPPVRRALL